MDFLSWAGTRIPLVRRDKTLRIRAVHMDGADEGIVQAVAKAAGALSPRLHQWSPHSQPKKLRVRCFSSEKARSFGLCVSRGRDPMLDAATLGPTLERIMPLIRELSETESAYVAGIVDGEGTITLTRTHRGEGRRPVVSISSTELPLSLRTYKLQRCRLLLDEYLAVTPRNGRYTPAQRAAKEIFEARFFALSIRAGTNRGGQSLNGYDDDRGIRAALEARAHRP